MWSEDPAGFARSVGITLRQAKHLQCTAEHCVAHQNGAKDSVDNIVAACRWCNLRRHRGRQQKAPDAETYKLKVSRSIAAGKGHPVAKLRASLGVQ